MDRKIALEIMKLRREVSYNSLRPYKFMNLVNELINGYGMEYCEVLMYINFGDTYDTTICYNSNTHQCFIGSWGDWYEHSSYYKDALKAEMRYERELKKSRKERILSKVNTI